MLTAKLGFKLFNDGAPFDVQRCASACTQQSQYNVAHPPTTGSPMTCQFFTTYILEKNGVGQGQYCAMYNETWNATYATNVGQYDSSGSHYTIDYSYAVSNASSPGVCTPLPTCGAQYCKAAPAPSMAAIASADCSSYLVQTVTAAPV